MASTSPNTSSEDRPRDLLAAHFAAWRAAGRHVLIPYVTAGYPRPQDTLALLAALADAGA